MYMTVEELQLEAFRQIRRKVSDITDESSNDEIAGYVKGIVNLESLAETCGLILR